GAKGIYGLYRNSVVNQYFSGRIDAFYSHPSGKWGLAFNYKRNDISFDENVIVPLNYNHFRLSAHKSFTTKSKGTFRFIVDANYILSNDKNVKNKIPLFAVFSWLSPLEKYYIEMNAHYFPTEVSNKIEMFPTLGMALFNYYVWAQAAFHYSIYSNTVQGLDRGWSINPEVTYYAIPQKLTFTGYGFYGEQIFSYTPGTLVLYMSEIVVTTNVGLTAYYYLSEELIPYLDYQYERYENRDIVQKFDASYFTIGFFYRL
ncbi:MAG: hypothetical protein ACE5GL_04730, partial [Calditrichia bacterium]